MTGPAHGAADPVGQSAELGTDAPTLLIEPDPAVWLAGPTAPDQVSAWTTGALVACAEDFGIAAGSAEHGYLAALLTGFATDGTGDGNRLLRLRGLRDVPVVARVDVFVGLESQEVADAFLAYDETELWFDPPQVADVDAARHLRRALRFRVDDAGMIHSDVRYHRRIDDQAVDIVVSCAGADPRAAAGALADLDALARAVWVVTDSGDRR